MTRPKAKSKKQHSVDFKKIRRKIGRKLPPPKNATNTEIKSKAIVLPEQSVAAEKEGLAVNKKGLTLKELLQQTSHHNAKVRRDALLGIKDLFTKHPTELKLHTYAAIEKLRQRISDEDRNVRKSLYDLFKLVIFPGCKEDNQELITSLLMAYVFHAMTHLAVDIRVMAFDFLHLVLDFYPPSFLSYAEKILQNYGDILRKNQYHLQDKGKLKDALEGLVRCLSLLPWIEGGNNLQNKNDCAQRVVLQGYEADMPVSSTGFSHIIKKLGDLVPVLLNTFEEFIPSLHATTSLEGKSFGSMLSILHIIELIVRSFVNGTKEESKYRRIQGGPVESMWDDTISSILLKKLFPLFPFNQVEHLSEKDNDRLLDLNMVIAKIFFGLNEWVPLPPDLLEKFLEFLEDALLGKICKATQTGMAVWEKHLAHLLSFIPKFVSSGTSYWTSRLLQAFTKIFRESNSSSMLKMTCLSTIEDIRSRIENMMIRILPVGSVEPSNPVNPELLDALNMWITELPQLLIQLGDKHPACSEAVLRLQHSIGQRGLSSSSLVCTYDNIQDMMQEFYSTCQEGGQICYGPFLRLPIESQKLSLYCLYYVSHLELPILKSIIRCCLSPELDPSMLICIIDLLECAYEAGRIKVADQLSVYLTLVARYKVSPVVESAGLKSDLLCQTWKTMTRRICSYLVSMGDKSLILRLIEELIIDQIQLKLPLDNICCLLRMVVTLDSKPTQLSEQSILTLGHCVSEYLVDVTQYIPEDYAEQCTPLSQLTTACYYLLPCFFLFDACHKLMSLVLKSMGSAITESSWRSTSDICTQHKKNLLFTVNAVASVLLILDDDLKLQQIMPSFKEDINNILQNVLSLQKINMTIEERHIVKCTYDRLKKLRSFGMRV